MFHFLIFLFIIPRDYRVDMARMPVNKKKKTVSVSYMAKSRIAMTFYIYIYILQKQFKIRSGIFNYMI